MAKRKEQIDAIEILKENLGNYKGEASLCNAQNALERLAEYIQTDEFGKGFQHYCAFHTEKDTSTSPIGNRGLTYVGIIKSIFNFYKI